MHPIIGCAAEVQAAFKGVASVEPAFMTVGERQAALVAPTLLGGLLFAPNTVAPDFKKLDPLAGLARLFSAQSLAELLKALAKSLLIGIVAFLVIRQGLDAMLGAMREAPAAGIAHMLAVVARSCAWVIVIGVPIGT